MEAATSMGNGTLNSFIFQCLWEGCAKEAK